MKWIAVFLFMIYVACSAAPVHPGDLTPQFDPAICQNGHNATRTCCIDHAALWISDVVPLDDVDYIQIGPYSCANPSYCLYEIASTGVERDPRSIPLSSVASVEATDPDLYFSGSRSSCAVLSFILCKHLGGRQWQCYAKAARDDVLVKFTQELECIYVDDLREDGTTHTMLQVGTCYILQSTWHLAQDAPVGDEKPYALLSTNTKLSFSFPIVNPAAVDALNAQGGNINRVVRRSDPLFATAFLPPPLADHFSELPPSLQRSLIDLVQLVFRSVFFTLFCSFLVMLMGVLLAIGVFSAKMSVLHARIDRIDAASSSMESDEDDESEGESYQLGAAEMYPVAYTPVAAAELEAKV